MGVHVGRYLGLIAFMLPDPTFKIVERHPFTFMDGFFQHEVDLWLLRVGFFRCHNSRFRSAVPIVVQAQMINVNNHYYDSKCCRRP